MEIYAIFAMNIIAILIMIWRFERSAGDLREDILDEIAAIERMVDLDESEGDVIKIDAKPIPQGNRGRLWSK